MFARANALSRDVAKFLLKMLKVTVFLRINIRLFFVEWFHLDQEAAYFYALYRETRCFSCFSLLLQFNDYIYQSMRS